MTYGNSTNMKCPYCGYDYSEPPTPPTPPKYMKIIKEGNGGKLYRGTCKNCDTVIECKRNELTFDWCVDKHIIRDCPHCHVIDRIVFEEYPPVEKLSIQKGSWLEAICTIVFVIVFMVVLASGLGYLLTHDTVYKQQQIELRK
jgi:hypothetical protein